MKRFCIVLFALSAVACAQVPAGADGVSTTQQNRMVNKSDMYCSGFVGKPLPRDRFVEGGLHSPNASRFATRDLIFLRGSGYQVGTRLSIVRAERDPAVFSAMKEDHKLLSGLGEVYGDIGYATVKEIRGKDTAIAEVEFSCEPIVTGDLVTAFTERPIPTQQAQSTYDRFPAHDAEVGGRIVATRDFDQFAATGRKVYLNIGANKGVKAGDHFQVVRGYAPKDTDIAEEVSLHATYLEDTQKNPPQLPNSKLKNLPKRVIGEVVVLTTQPGTATAMVVNSLEEVHVGDAVETRQ